MWTAILFVGIVHLLGYLVAYFKQTDHFTDIIYALSFVIIAGYGVYLHPNPGVFHWVLFLMITIWAIRLSVYLGYRIRVWGLDKRFDRFRGSWSGLLKFWLLQYLSIIVISLPILFNVTKPEGVFGFWQGFGAVIFLFGFLMETFADYQKFMFKLNPKNKNSFIQNGLWRYSRHPNYLGEWLVWLGVFIFSMPLLQGYEWVAIISPIWIFVLLRYISGGNLLEKSAKSKYSDQPDYQAYLERTGIFFPKLQWK
jgi:steroid 5-alpha reductase family enzyme